VLDPVKSIPFPITQLLRAPVQARALWRAGAAVVTAGICEEVIYRGFLLRYLQEGPMRLNAPIALIFSSVMFGLFHAGQGVGAILGTAVGGFLFGVIFLGRGSLLLPILLHALNNLRVVAMAYLASG